MTDCALSVRVSLFITCFNDTLFPDTGRATVTLLERLGCEVEFRPEQTCCGQMHGNSGYDDAARPLAERFGRVFGDAEVVVSPSASCVGFVRDHYERIGVPFSGPPVYELSEFVIDVLGVEDVGASFPHRVTLHPTCHSVRALHVGDRPERLLRAVRGIDLVEMDEALECCGFGGTFAIKNADVSTAMLADKLRHILDTRAEVCCAADNSCLLHIAEVLASTERQAGKAQADQPAESAQWRGQPEKEVSA